MESLSKLSKNRFSLEKCEISDICLFIFFCVINGNRTQELTDRVLYVVTFSLLLFSSYFLYVWKPKSQNKPRKKIGNIFIAWVILFWLYALSSTIWSVDRSSSLDTTMMDDILQAVTILPYLIVRVNSKEDFLFILKLYVFASLYGVFMLVLKTPIGAWGTERVGNAIGLHSNSVGMNMAYASFISFFLAKETKNWKYFLLIIAFLPVVVFSGSRKAIFIFLLSITLLWVLTGKGIKGLLYLLLAFAVVVVFFNIVMSNQVLYGIIGSRLDGLFSYFTGVGQVDSSSEYRDMYRTYALQIWMEYPLFGSGLNTFRYFNQLFLTGVYVYCHCNYLEILSGLGLVGFALYYSIFVLMGKRLIKSFNRHKTNLVIFCFVFLVCRFIFDYGFVSYSEFQTFLYLALIFCGTRISEKET